MPRSTPFAICPRDDDHVRPASPRRTYAAERGEMRQASGTTRLLAQVIEQAHDLILVLTATAGAVTRTTRSAGDGVLAWELATLHARNLMVQESVSAEDIQSVVRSGRAWQGALTRTRRDGSTFPVLASVVGLVDENGQISHVVSVERDISEERRLREQLIHSERLSAVGQLVAGVAHEINNPLQGIIGYTELLLAGDSQQDVRRDLEQIHSDANRVAKIVRHLWRSRGARSGPSVADSTRRQVDVVGGSSTCERPPRARERCRPGAPDRHQPERSTIHPHLVLNAEQGFDHRAHGAFRAHGVARVCVRRGR